MLTVKNLAIELMMTPIVTDITFQLSAAQCVAIIGPSGCGKTTILRAIAGLIEYQSGVIEHTFTRIAYLFQEPRLLPWRTAEDNIRLVHPQSTEADIVQLIEQLGLTVKDLQKYPCELSGGMQQRVSLARALITRPHLLIMDEPFSALDHQLRQRLQQLIVRHIHQGLAVCMVTHDREEAVALAHQIIRLDGSPATISACEHIALPHAERSRSVIDHYLTRPIFTGIESE